MIWHKKLKNFLQNGQNGLISCNGVIPEGAALHILRALEAMPPDETLAVTMPDAPSVERVLDELEKLRKISGSAKTILSVPECGRGKLLFPGGEARRARALNRILNEKFSLVIGSVHALLGAAPPPDESADSQLELRCGMRLSIAELLDKLVTLDYDDEVMVSVSGEFSRRGGIVDIFSPAHDEPCRIEFFGDEIDTMRFFSPQTQRSTGAAEVYKVINRAGITAGGAADSDVFAYLERAGKFRMVDVWQENSIEILEKYSVPGAVERWQQLYNEHQGIRFCDIPETGLPFSEISGIYPVNGGGLMPGEAAYRAGKVRFELLMKRLQDVLSAPDGQVVLLADDPEDIPLVRTWWTNTCTDDAVNSRISFDSMSLRGGWVIGGNINLAVVCEHELAEAGFSRSVAIDDEDDPQSAAESAASDSAAPAIPEITLTDFDEGDYVVHLDYGIAIYRGINRQESNGIRREMLTLEFRDGQILNVPMMHAARISRYLGAPGKVKLHSPGNARWNNEKESVRNGVRSYAADMLRFQAVRQQIKGLSFPVSAGQFRAFIRAFPFKDTVCQSRATREIAVDMSSAKPMDRLLCGDVGFGKTEIAMRAAFRAVANGCQVAVIAPTTVLAQQHYNSFVERFREYPFVIDTVSRFRTNQEQDKIITKLASGGIDIIIGTHRLCGSSFKFRNLGLVIIDEEQRFGVDHKERLRRFRVEADVLSMSATPIPRTLYLAMAGARDLSTLLTAPKLRLPVKTVIAPQEDELVINAIKAELARGGQVYYLHNRVKTIESCAAKLREALPESRIAVGHGQMAESELAAVMENFLAGKTDVLVCSTIIESGLDVPNANTIIIERADRFGLAELYQLRGRVGRWKQQAYAYMLLPKDALVGSAARKRLAAIRRCSSMGAGFQLALQDLEIRGAGNLLGSEQSGHLNMIGFDLYCHLLKQEIALLRGEKGTDLLDLPEMTIEFIQFAQKVPGGMLSACFPADFIENEHMRISAYRKLANIKNISGIDDYAEELTDIYGKLPEQVLNLLECMKLQIMVARAGYKTLTVASGIVSISNPGEVVYRKNGKIPRLDPRDPAKLRLKQLVAIVKELPVKIPERAD